MKQANLIKVRSFYAKTLAQVSASHDPRVEEVFNTVHREAFLPPGPWKLLVDGQYIETPNDDPINVYQNFAIALNPAKGINNGEPHLHAQWIGAVSPRPGETAIQIGLGMGYYSAILSLLVQPCGCLIGFELDQEMAEASRINLAMFDNVSIVTGNATSLNLPPSDIIYVSASVTAPPTHWLASLRLNGRIVFPWRPSDDVALAMLITRVVSGFEVRPLKPAWFIPCAGASIQKKHLREMNLSAARHIRSLHFKHEHPPDDSTVIEYDEFWFSTAEVRK
jgi:protein-L-isoaspartate(D-aspartate) O-methyltransferase